MIENSAENYEISKWKNQISPKNYFRIWWNETGLNRILKLHWYEINFGEHNLISSKMLRSRFSQLTWRKMMRRVDTAWWKYTVFELKENDFSFLRKVEAFSPYNSREFHWTPYDFQLFLSDRTIYFQVATVYFTKTEKYTFPRWLAWLQSLNKSFR